MIYNSQSFDGTSENLYFFKKMYSDKKLNLQLVKISIVITASFVVFSFFFHGLSTKSSRLTRFASVVERLAIGARFERSGMRLANGSAYTRM